MALSILRRHGLAVGSRWIDIGCGPGGNLGMLDSMRPVKVVGVDLSSTALEFAKSYAPSAELLQADINERLPFDDGTFDVATMFNVLYHQWVKDEQAILKEVARILAPRGLLLLTEPAFEGMRRDLDDAVMTRRRYRLADFAGWLEVAGFETLLGSYFTSFGFPLVSVANHFRSIVKRKVKPESPTEFRPLPTFINETLFRVARVEGQVISRHLTLPFGTTLVMLARRRAQH